jgi:hypothetical protein
MRAWTSFACCGLLACEAAGADLAVTPDHGVVTVAGFSFQPDPVERTRVEVDDAQGPLLAGDWVEAGDHRVSTQLVALPASSALRARIVTESGEVLDESAFETGALPATVPSLTLTGEPGWTGYAFTGMLGSGHLAVVLDERGQVAWYHTTVGSEGIPRVRLRPDGGGVTFLLSRGGGGGPRYLADVDWGHTAERRFASDQSLTHDFVFLPDGSLGALVTTEVVYDGVPELGGALIELDPDGTSERVWDGASIWPDGVPDSESDRGPHVNTLRYDADRDWWWWGVENADTILRLDRATGELQPALGGAISAYAFPNDDGLQRPHHFWLDGDRLRVHDNRDVELGSRVVEYQLDDDARTATRTGEWAHDPRLYDFALGDVTTRDDGSMLVTWSSSGILDDFGPDGTIRASIAASFGYAFGYTEVHDTLPNQVRLR